MAQYKLNITVPPHLMQQIDDYCKQMYLSRSGFFQAAAVAYLTANQMAAAMMHLSSVLSDIAAAGGVSPEQQQQLDEIEQLVSLIQSKGGVLGGTYQEDAQAR